MRIHITGDESQDRVLFNCIPSRDLHFYITQLEVLIMIQTQIRGLCLNIVEMSPLTTSYIFMYKAMQGRICMTFKTCKILTHSPFFWKCKGRCQGGQWSGQVPISPRRLPGPGIRCKFLTFGPKCQRLPPPDSWNRKTFLGPRLGIILRLNVTRKLGQRSSDGEWRQWTVKHKTIWWSLTVVVYCFIEILKIIPLSNITGI